jgi:hypothetical protein
MLSGHATIGQSDVKHNLVGAMPSKNLEGKNILLLLKAWATTTTVADRP